MVLGRVPPRGRAVRPGQSGTRGVMGGVWPVWSLYLGPSLCLSRACTKAGVIGVAQIMEGVVSIPFRLVSAC